MPSSPRVRFAPSPTGELHIGGVRTALYNWAYAKHFNGTFILRIEDTDTERSTEESKNTIIEGMTWLGLDWDEGPGVGGDYGPYFQMERQHLYDEALTQLIEKGRAYPCFCSAEKLEAHREKAREEGKSFHGYNGACRKLSQDEAQERIDAGEDHVWRFAMPENPSVTMNDLVHGSSSFGKDQLDDFVLIRTDGTPTYNFVCVVDDAHMKITHVIRGDDHYSNTPKQIALYEALGWEVPEFAHLSMIHGEDGKRLSKRHGATSVQEFKERGFLPEALINYLALLGWSLDGETTLMTPETIAENFDLDRVSKNPATFDNEKLIWVNAEHIKKLSPSDFSERILMPELEKAGLATAEDYQNNPQWFDAICPLVNERIKLVPEVVEKVEFLFLDEPIELDEKSANKHLKKEGANKALTAAYEALSEIPEANWNTDAINEAIQELPDKLELKKGVFFQSIRVSVAGSQVSPPLSESLELLGKERTLTRLQDALPVTTEE